MNEVRHVMPIIIKFGELFPYISLIICFEKLGKTQAAPHFFNLLLSVWISHETLFLYYIFLNIFLTIMKFWIHLESLPENSITKQCLIISNQLANSENIFYVNG